MRILEAGLASVSLLWGLAAILDPRIGMHQRLPGGPALLAIHVAIGLLLLARKTAPLGALAFSTLTGYYWLRVKPFEPLAEPQTVGLCAVSLYLALGYWSQLERLYHRWWPVQLLQPILLRGGVAYPFVEWGLDALRNPTHFKACISGNQLALLIAGPMGVDRAVFLLFLIELSLALLILSGAWSRAVGIASASLLLLFVVVAGYPLALPQNLGLIAASIRIAQVSAGGGYRMRLNFADVYSSRGAAKK